ncbi:MAG: glycosyltransferase [Planctomycetes bacterium]|nr:glycosyltransferase [Planctomycetota bacterium]
MQRILFVIPSLDYGGGAGQLVELLRALPREQFQSRVVVLGRSGPWAERLRQDGIDVDVPGRGRLFDLRPLVRLREVVRSFTPSVLHAWRLRSLRAAALSRFKGRLVASPLLRSPDERSWLRWLDARLLRRADRIIAFGETDAVRCGRLGVEGQRLVTVNPGVRQGPLPPSADVPGVPAAGRVVLCVGPLRMQRGFQEAIWALDILQYVHPDLHLVLAGDGPDRAPLEAFAAGLRVSAGVHFGGPGADVPALMSRAEVVWVPGRVECGMQVVLEAMAAGRPVVASNWPRLAELVREGETGYLVPPGDKTTIARQTQRLLADADLRRSMGEAARRRVAEHFRADELAECCARVYLGGK